MFGSLKYATMCVVLLVAAGVGQADTNTALPIEMEDCDYNDAVLHYGWGWDESTGKSCKPDPGFTIAEFVNLYEATEPDASYDEIIELIRKDYCDYGNANLYNGYGWNNVLLESCPPPGGSGRPVIVMQP